WRKTLHGSRPGTPVNSAPSIGDEGEDSRSEYGSEGSTPRRRSAPKPKLGRYLSSYLALTAPPKPLDFSEPWSEKEPVLFRPPVDPIIVLRSVRSHLCRSPSQSIPEQQHSGLLRIFEDYRKVREEKERLDEILRKTLEGYKMAEENWSTAEGRYQAEIRRLELIIARGTTGMSGLIRARQESIIKRERPYRKTMSTDHLETAYEFLSREQLDQQIISQSQRVLIHRPSSPSSKMAALSRRFLSTSLHDDLPFGTPPSQDRILTLTRKVKSELDLAKLGTTIEATSNSDSGSRSVYSEFSASGDPLPDEIEHSTSTILDARIEGDAFVALRDLAVLVARRKGMKAEKFLSRLLNLFSSEDEGSESDFEENDTIKFMPTKVDEDTSNWTPERHLGHFRSQPYLSSDESRRRHFSFEPGDDQLGLLEKGLKTFQTNQTDTSIGSLSRASSGILPLSDPLSESSLTRSMALGPDIQKRSKIPSPVQWPVMGRMRRENSASNSQSVLGGSQREDGRRRDSSSSIITAFRQTSKGSQRPQPTSRSSSM
ncbi:hypothetical protein K469DRAFT_512939, partial [Zopfia rhizophila CBS 207.26]